MMATPWMRAGALATTPSRASRRSAAACSELTDFMRKESQQWGAIARERKISGE